MYVDMCKTQIFDKEHLDMLKFSVECTYISGYTGADMFTYQN